MQRDGTAITEIEIECDGGRSISADLYIGAPRCALPIVIVCHGFLGYKRWAFFPYLSERLAASGLHVLTVSFSMNGIDDETGLITRPEDFSNNTVSREVADLTRVGRYIRGGGLPVEIDETAGWGLFGYSRGAAVALIIAHRFTETGSLVTWATPSRLDRYSPRRKEQWKRDGTLSFQDSRAAAPLELDYSYYEDIMENWGDLDLPALASTLGRPHLMVHCERDAAVTLGETMKLIRRGGGDAVQLRIIPGCGHTFGVTHPMKRASDEVKRGVSLTRNWFTRTLRRNERSRIDAS